MEPASNEEQSSQGPAQSRAWFRDVPTKWKCIMFWSGVFMPLLCALSAGYGVPLVRVQADIWQVWVPQAGDFWEDKQHQIRADEEADPEPPKGGGAAAGMLLAVPRNGGNVMTKESVLEVIAREQAVESITVQVKNYTLTFQDVCSGQLGSLWLGYSFPCPKLTPTQAFMEGGYDMGPTASMLWFQVILMGAFVRPLITPLVLATDYPPSCAQEGGCLFQCQVPCSGAWAMAAMGNLLAFRADPGCVSCMVGAERDLIAQLENATFAAKVGLAAPFFPENVSAKANWLYYASARGYLRTVSTPVTMPDDSDDNGTSSDDNGTSSDDNGTSGDENGTSSDDHGTSSPVNKDPSNMTTAEVDAAVASSLAQLFGITPGLTNAFTINQPALGARFAKGARSLEADATTTEDVLRWATDDICGWGACYAAELTLGLPRPGYGEYSNPDQPLQSVGALEIFMQIMTNAEVLQRKIQDPMRPGGALPRLEEDDLREALTEFKAKVDTVWSNGWQDESSSDLNYYYSFVYPDTFVRSMDELTKDAIVPGILSYASIIGVSMLMLSSCYLTESKALVGAIGVVYAIIAFLAAMTVTLVSRVPLQLSSLWTLPFLMVGLGVDDTYVILLSLLQGGGETFGGYLKAFKRVLVPVTMTSLVNAGMFAMTITSSIPACYETGKTAVYAVLLQYVTIVTSFPVVCYLDMVRQRNGRVDILCCVKGKRGPEPFKNIIYTRAFRPFITSKLTHALSVVVTLALLAAAIVGTTRVELGMTLNEFFRTGSLEEVFFQQRDKYFPTWPAGMAFGQLDYWNPETQLEMAKAFEGVTDSHYIPSMPTTTLWTMELALWGSGHCFGLGQAGRCGSEWGCHATWVENTRGLKNLTAESPGVCRSGSSIIPNTLAGEAATSYVADTEYCPVMPLANQEELADCLAKWVRFGGGNPPGYLMQADGVTPQLPIKYTRVFSQNFFSINLHGNEGYVNAISTTRAHCDDNERIHCWMTGIAYDFWEQYLTIWEFSSMTLGLAVLMGFVLSFGFLVFSFLLEGRKTTTLRMKLVAALCGSWLIVFCMLLSVFTSFGICCLLGLKFTVLTVMSYLMAIGFSVEYAVHVIHRFLTAPLEHDTPSKRVDHSLELLFMPMCTSFLASIVGIIGMGFSEISLVFTYHFVPLLVVQLVTFFYGCFLLPSLLCYFPCAALQISVDEDSTQPPTMADVLEKSEASTPGLGSATPYVLKLATIFVDVGAPKDEAAPEDKKLTACRFLLSLRFLDTLYQLPGYMISLELLFLSYELDNWCYLLVAIIQRTLNNFSLALVSIFTPRIFKWYTGAEWISSKQLVQFAVKMYFFSGTFAMLLLPVVPAVALYTGEYKNPLAILLMGIYYQVCYLTFNSIGDQAIELARPHWMRTFEGLELSFPGCRCCGGCKLARPAGPSTLPAYQNISRGFWIFPVYIVGLGAGGQSLFGTLLRWGFAVIFGVLALILGFIIFKDTEVLSQGISEEQVDIKQHKNIRPLSSLQPFEYTYVFGYWLLVGFPGLAISALYNIVIVETPPGLLIVLAIVVIAMSYVSFFTRIVSGSKADRRARLGTSEGTYAWNPGFFRAWFCPIFAILLLVVLGSTVLYAVEGLVGVYASVICYLPASVFISWLAMSVDTFMLKYDEDRRTDLEYYRNVAWALAQLPLLAVNWGAVTAVGCGDGEGAEAGSEAEKTAANVMFFIAMGVVAFAVLFIGLVDRILPEGKSLWKAVDAWAMLGKPSGATSQADGSQEVAM